MKRKSKITDPPEVPISKNITETRSEALAMEAIVHIFNGFSFGAQERMLAYIQSRFHEDVRSRYETPTIGYPMEAKQPS